MFFCLFHHISRKFWLFTLALIKLGLLFVQRKIYLTLQRGRNNEGNKFGGVLLAARSTKAACTPPPPLMFSSTSSRATHLFLSCVVTRALILFFFCLQRKMQRTPPLKFAPTRGEDKPPPDRTRSDSRPAGKCFKVRTHACREVAHLSCEQGPPPPFYCKAQVQHTSSFGSLVEQNECKINTAGIRTASDLYTKILTIQKGLKLLFYL